MKKVILLGAVLTCLAGIPAANAQIIIQPTLVESPVAPVFTSPVIVETPVYPVHIDHHHRYDWHYWDQRRHDDRR